MKRVIVITALYVFTMSNDVKSQVNSPPTHPYEKQAYLHKQPIKYPHLREADVMFVRRIWRQMDLRQKFNHPLYFPINQINDRKSLWDVLVLGIEDGVITPYKLGPLLDDEFQYPLTIAEFTDIIRQIDTVEFIDPDTDQVEFMPVETLVKSEDIKAYDLKEEWFFDKQRSVMDVRILGICPNKIKINDDGDIVGLQPLFWVYFPEARYILANFESFNRHNDEERRTFDEVFTKRMFSSFITKRSNVYDRFIAEYKLGMSALLEGEAIKREIFNFEQDIWHY